MVEGEKFLFEPGQGMIYSNSGYFFLGLVIEKVSGKSYREYLKEAFFTPLGLNETCYCSHRRLIKNKVEGYGYTPTKFRKKAFLNHQWPYAAGSLCSTTADLLKWLQALHTGKVFSQKNYQAFITPGTLNNGTNLRYAMGIMNYQYKGNPIIGHGGGIPGFLSATRYYPQQDLYIVCLVNTVGPASARFFANQITDKILGNTEPAPKKVDIDLKKVAGTYSGQGRGQIITIKVSTQGETVVVNLGKQKRKFSNYRGNGIWVKGSDQIKFVNGEWHWDNLAGYYILKKKS
jgi:CubicO group peptidase (beta-lactamase class C family)